MSDYEYDSEFNLNPFGFDPDILEELASSDDLTLERYLDIVHENPVYIKKISKTVPFYDRIARFAVELDGTCIQFIQEKTEDLCRAAVECTYLALSCISEEEPFYNSLCMIAVRNDGKALEFIDCEHHDDEMCLIALRSYPKAIESIADPTEEMCMIAVQADPNTIKYIYDPPMEAVKYALARKPHLLSRVKRELTEEMFQVIVDNHPTIARNLVYENYPDFAHLTYPKNLGKR